MLIVGQGGNVINLNVVSILGVDEEKTPQLEPVADKNLSEYHLIAEVQRNFPDIGSLAADIDNVFFYRFCLGSYEYREQAEKVLEELVSAYERGLKVYRVPIKEEKFNVDSQC